MGLHPFVADYSRNELRAFIVVRFQVGKHFAKCLVKRFILIAQDIARFQEADVTAAAKDDTAKGWKYQTRSIQLILALFPPGIGAACFVAGRSHDNERFALRATYACVLASPLLKRLVEAQGF